MKIRVVLGVLAGLVALGVVADFTTASPTLCESCHEIEPRAAEWRESAHAEIACVECHERPTAWYDVPTRLLARGGLLARDVSSHLSGDYDDPVDSRVPGAKPMPDAICLQCHTPDRQATSGYRILIKHEEHAKRNGSCVSCHLRTGHPEPERGRPLSLMGQCFMCHGTPEQPKALAACAVCHPTDFDLRPTSHEAKGWQESHGRVADVDRRQCTMCHTAKSCADCHGLEMPHPAGWDKGPAGHAVVAQRDSAVCVRCHHEKPDLCSMCHHRGFSATGTAWLQQHPEKVRDGGAGFCEECHERVYCVRCHTKWASTTR